MLNFKIEKKKNNFLEKLKANFKNFRNTKHILPYFLYFICICMIIKKIEPTDFGSWILHWGQRWWWTSGACGGGAQNHQDAKLTKLAKEL